jgi:hypothetical protein
MNLPTIDIKGKPYVLVKDRILAFHELHPNGSIVAEQLPDTERVLVRATVTPDVANPARIFTAHSQAIWGDGYINKTSALENAETSAVGRALAMLGIGIIDSVASADEMAKAATANAAKPRAELSQETINLWVNSLKACKTPAELEVQVDKLRRSTEEIRTCPAVIDAYKMAHLRVSNPSPPPVEASATKPVMHESHEENGNNPWADTIAKIKASDAEQLKVIARELATNQPMREACHVAWNAQWAEVGK